MRIRMISNLMAVGHDASRNLWKQFDLTTKHEERRLEIVSTKHFENALGVFRRTVVKRQSHRCRVSAPAPVGWAEPLRAHGVGRVIDARRARRERAGTGNW